MTVDPSKPKRSLAVCCFCIHLSVFLGALSRFTEERTEENVHTHVSVVQRAGSLLFSTDDSCGGWERVCSCVLGVPAGVFSSSVCQQVTSASSERRLGCLPR